MLFLELLGIVCRFLRSGYFWDLCTDKIRICSLLPVLRGGGQAILNVAEWLKKEKEETWASLFYCPDNCNGEEEEGMRTG